MLFGYFLHFIGICEHMVGLNRLQKFLKVLYLIHVYVFMYMYVYESQATDLISRLINTYFTFIFLPHLMKYC